MRCVNTSIGAFVLVILLSQVGCISPTPIEGALCPCPDGYYCCETQNACLANQSNCPSTQSSSSEKDCSFDAQCPSNEYCHAWTGADKQIRGPQKCRQPCTSAHPCAQGERCSIAPSNGDSLSVTNTQRMCVPTQPAAGCENVSCNECADEQFSALFCGQNDTDSIVQTCAYALSVQCGLNCSFKTIEVCEQDAPCVTHNDETKCSKTWTFPLFDPCDDFNCEKCASRPGEYTCSGNDIIQCSTVAYPGETCNQICFLDTQSCGDNRICVEQNGSAFCAEQPITN